MNDTGLGSVDATDVITTAHLILIALVAIAAILVIWWGARRRRARLHASHDAEARREQVTETAPDPGIAEASAIPAPHPTPVEAVPPPVRETPAAATPVPVKPAKAITPATAKPGKSAAAKSTKRTPTKPAEPVATEEPAPIEPNKPATLKSTPAAKPAVSSAASEDITVVKGLGPKVAARLAELGITRIDQIAALSPADAAALDAQLGAFSGRMARDRWIEQARLLATGDRAGFEAIFGKL